jgi:hypothetical protein
MRNLLVTFCFNCLLFFCISGYQGVILFCPAGRKTTLEIQIKYTLKLLEYFDDLIARYDIWDVAWTEEDSTYIKTLSQLHPKIRVLYTPYVGGGKRGGETASKQFAFIYSTYYRHEIYKDYIFVKLDDDIVFIDIAMFPFFIQHRVQSDAFLFSANIINCIGDTPPEYFVDIHQDFLMNFGAILSNHRLNKTITPHDREFVLSINFVSFLGKDLEKINLEFSDGTGAMDEFRLYHKIPDYYDLQNEIDGSFTAVHYSYGQAPQIYYGHFYHSFLPYYHQLHEEFIKSNDDQIISLRSVYKQMVSEILAVNSSYTTNTL